jgi:Kef-type K+ transport system membrane component KefB
VVAALAAARYVLPRIFRPVAKVPELMLVVSLGWCFLLGLVAAHPSVGLSMEMGALIAGVAMATFPYNLDVIARVLSIRDFFITLFFVALGMQIPMPQVDVLVMAAVVGTVLVATRLAGVFGLLHLLGAGHWGSLLPTINLAQMSEFALVIVAIGVKLGHVGQESLTVVIWAFARPSRSWRSRPPIKSRPATAWSGS